MSIPKPETITNKSKQNNKKSEIDYLRCLSVAPVQKAHFSALFCCTDFTHKKKMLFKEMFRQFVPRPSQMISAKFYTCRNIVRTHHCLIGLVVKTTPGRGVGVRLGVGCRCLSIRNDMVTPPHLLQISLAFHVLVRK